MHGKDEVLESKPCVQGIEKVGPLMETPAWWMAMCDQMGGSCLTYGA